MHQLPEFDRMVPLIVVGVETIVLGVLAGRRFSREEF
jgi:hypothetical protein